MKTILIAEDDKKIAAALTIRLKAAGYRVVVTRDGYDGLKAAALERPDVIVTDIWMPVGTGLCLAEQLQEVGLQIPVIFITASHSDILVQKARQLNAFACFSKHYDSDHFLLENAPTTENQPSLLAPAHSERPRLEERPDA